MGLFDLFKKKTVSNSEVTSFEVKYVLALKDDFSNLDNDLAMSKCSERKILDGVKGGDCSFCKKILSEKRTWTRDSIEKLTQMLGYSVFDNPGCGYDEEGNSICSCMWKQVTVIKKK